jgi:hypothetical protein
METKTTTWRKEGKQTQVAGGAARWTASTSLVGEMRELRQGKKW